MQQIICKLLEIFVHFESTLYQFKEEINEKRMLLVCVQVIKQLF